MELEHNAQEELHREPTASSSFDRRKEYCLERSEGKMIPKEKNGEFDSDACDGEYNVTTGKAQRPEFLEKETLGLVERYLMEVHGKMETSNERKPNQNRSSSCDEDKMAAFMARVNRQAEIQTDFVVQTNLLLNDKIVLNHNSPWTTSKCNGSSRYENGSTSRLLDDFVKLEEEQALTREVFQEMVQTIEGTKARARNENGKSGNAISLDKRTLGWIRKCSGLCSGSDVSCANHQHPGIKSMIEGGTRRLTRGMARQHHDKRQQTMKQQQQARFGARSSERETEGLEALAWALNDLEKEVDQTTVDNTANDSRTKKRKSPPPPARVLRRRICSTYTHTESLSEATNNNSKPRLIEKQQQNGSPPKQVRRRRTGATHTRLSRRESCLETTTTTRTSIHLRSKGQSACNLPPIKSATTYSRLSHRQSSLETSKSTQNLRSKSTPRRHLSSTSRGVLRRTYARTLD